MIAHLSGTLLAKHATSVIVDVGGVGYEVTIPVTTFYDLGEPNTPVRLRVYTHVREAALPSPALEQEIAAGVAAGAPQSEDALREDTLAALIQLGFPRPAAEKAVNHAMSEGGELSVETLLRRSLRQLSKG